MDLISVLAAAAVILTITFFIAPRFIDFEESHDAPIADRLERF
jgi:hypothetical protein